MLKRPEQACDGSAGRRQMAGQVDARRRQVRAQEAQFRNWVTRTGAAGPSGKGGFRATRPLPPLCPLSCPWAHRTLIVRALKKLEDVISVSVVRRSDASTAGLRGRGGATGDTLYGSRPCTRSTPGRPANRPRHRAGAVGQETADDRLQRVLPDNHPDAEFGIRRMGRRLARPLSRAAARRDRSRQRLVYPATNNGVYRAGFASTQTGLRGGVRRTVRRARHAGGEAGRQRYLAGDRRITEADWRLFTTLARFDPVYVGHFKCNLRRIADYPNLSNYLRELYQVPGVAATVNLHHIKHRYYRKRPACAIRSACCRSDQRSIFRCRTTERDLTHDIMAGLSGHPRLSACKTWMPRHKAGYDQGRSGASWPMQRWIDRVWHTRFHDTKLTGARFEAEI